MPDEKIKILAIDDNQDNLTTIKAVLMDALPEAGVTISLNGERGIQLALAEDPDVILLDIVMPGMDGFEVCRRLKEDERLNPIPVIFLTALKTDRSSRIKALEAGAEAFLGKPIDEVELLAQIRAMVKIRAANKQRKIEKEQLAALVAARTAELEQELSERRKAEQELQEANRKLEKDRAVKLKLMEDLIAEIGARKKSESALQESEKLLRAFLENSAVIAWIKDRDGRLVFQSDNYRKRFQGPFPGAADSADPLPSPEYTGQFDGNDLAVLKDGLPIETEEQAVDPDGSPSWWLNNRFLFQDAVGKRYVGCLGVDITQRRKSDEENTRLETQLRQAQKLEAIGTLAGGIAHDFNNILAAILGYTEMALQDTRGKNTLQNDLNQVLRATHRAKDLVRQILAVSRHGEVQSRQPILVAPIVKEALKLLRSTLPTTIEFSQSVSEEAGQILGDPTQLHQVVVNLCTNAAHAMREKGGTLEATLGKVELSGESARAFENLPAGPYVELTVRDTGHGMDAPTLERIFDPYFTTKEIGEGSGLGLAVVHGIVKRHEGAVTVRSESGKGTFFRILFPRIDARGVPADGEQSYLAGGTEHILFVDDEEQLVTLGERMLDSLSYRVTTRQNSLEAVELFRQQPDAFDLVITDYTMPHMTGLDLAREILRVRPDIPVVLCTGYSEMITEATAKRAGVRAFAMKPLSRNSIAEVVRSVLDGKKH